MVPSRLYLEGFLSYREPQEIVFDDADVWLLSGDNGSGKSSVFDALTFALFGGHRDGKDRHIELINNQSQSAVVEFDFLLGDELYQVRRTLKRGAKGGARGAQQVLKRVDREGLLGSRWEEVAQTSTANGFRDWIQERIGLTYETFIASVLLMQGRAERLLEAGGAGRFQVLAAIVDLERYQKLHEKAKAKRDQQKARFDALRGQWQALPDVTDDEFAEAERAAVEAGDELDAIKRVLANQRQTAILAERWAGLLAEVAEAERWLRDVEILFARAEALERQVQRLNELRAIAPVLKSATRERDALRTLSESVAQMEAERRTLVQRVQPLDDERTKTASEWESAKGEASSGWERESEIQRRLGELAGPLAELRFVEQAIRERDRIRAEIAKLPHDPAAALARDRAEAEESSALSVSAKVLERLRDEWEDWASSRRRLASAEKMATAAADEFARAQDLATAKAQEYESQDLKVRDLQNRGAIARSQADQARQRWEQLDRLQDAAACDACGQPLTPSHREEERERRLSALQSSEEELRQARGDYREAYRIADSLKKHKEQLERHRDDARSGHEDCRRKWEEADRERQRLERSYDRIHKELNGAAPELSRAEVESQTSGNPAEPRLQRALRRLEELRGAEARLKKSQAVWESWSRFDAELASAERALRDRGQGLPDDPEPLRREHARLQSEREAVQANVKQAKDRERESRARLETLDAARTDLERRLAQIDQGLAGESARRRGLADALERALSRLPDGWPERFERLSARDIAELDRELAEAERSNPESQLEQAAQARATIVFRRDRLAELQAKRDAVPDADRILPRDADEIAKQAERKRSDAEKQWRKRIQERDRLADRRQRRQELDDQIRETERAFRIHDALVKLLGRDRLQRHLVRQAERAIVDHASVVLDRLSGGQLRLRLREREDGGLEEALQLEAFHDAAGSDPIPAAFLSGSQRFRVAVSLALGIGQYASRQHRPIESVIIDEGFGCLDRQGRQVMIQELRNLRGHVKRILLVSHQEEFAEAFPDGYRFELTDQGTIATRFHRH